MLQDEEEKKKREEEARAIISGIGGTINTINYANLKGRTLTTKNENEQNFINRVNEANSIINSINQRKNVPAPSATTEEIEEGHRNVQPLLDLMDKNSEPEIDNTINTVQESSSNPNSNSRFRINGSKSKEEIDKQVKKANSQNVQANTSKNNSIVDKDVKIGLASKADMQNAQELSTSDIKGMEKSNELNEDIEKGGIDKFNAQLEVFLSSIYGGFKQTISGLANVVTTGLGLGLRGLAGASYIFGLEDTGKKFDETYNNVIKTGSDINETANYERTVNSQIDDEFTKTVGDVTNVISNMLSSQVIGYAIPSSVPGVVIQGISVGGNSAQEVLDENKDNIGKATLTGIAKGYTSYLTEKMFDANILTRGTGKTSIQKSVDKLISNRINSRLGKEVVNKTVGIIGENAEELVEDNVDNLIDKLINNKDLPGFQEWWENTTETAKVTTISTLIMSMLGLGGESFHNKEVDMEADYWIGEAQKIIEQEDLAIHFNPSEVKTLDDVKDFFITRFTPDGEIANVVATKGKEIANPNENLNVKPAIVKDNITNYYNVIDEDTGIVLDSTPYETTMEAQSGFTEKANKLSDIQLRDINQKIEKANYAVTNEFVRVINAAKEELSQITTADYKINQNTNVNNAQTTSEENTTNYNQEETNYVVQDINKVTEPFSKQENYSKDELADVWNNEVSNNNFDAYYDNNGNIGSYIAIEEEGRDIVVNQYDNQDNIVRSAVIPSDNGRYNSEDVRDTILKVASNTDLNPYIQEMATNFQDDLANTLPGERYKAGDTWTGQKRATTKELADIKDETGASWNKIGEVLDDIANGRKNNTKLARAIENKLDEALSQGYTNIYGKVVNPNEEYLEQKSKVYGRDFTQNNNDYNPTENMTEDDYRIFGMKKNKKETTNRQGLQLPNSESKVSNKSITQNRDIIKSIEKFEKAKENIDRETVVTIANSLDIKIKEGAEKIENTNMSKLAGKNKTPNIVTIDELFKDLTSKNIKEYRKEAESIANRLYRDKVVTIYDTQTKTEINKSGIEKTLSGNITKSKVQSINQLQDIIQEGIYGYTTYNPDDNNGILYHHFFTPVNYQNKNGLIRVVIREFTNDNSLNDKYYYHQLEFISNKKIEGINALPQINGNKEIKFLPSTKKSIPQKSQSVKNNARQNKTQKSIKSLQYIKTKYKNQTDQLNIFENKDNTIGINNLVVKQNLRNKGIGQNILNDIIDYADKKGKTITLTPTSQYLTKNRLTNWYKKNGFVENKGKNTNFSISDTMYRLPKNNTQNVKNDGVRTMKKNNTIDNLMEDIISKEKDNFSSGIQIDTTVVDNILSIPLNYKKAGQSTLSNLAKKLFGKLHKRVLNNKSEKIYVTNSDINESIAQTLKNPKQKAILKDNIAVFSQLDKIVENAKEIKSSDTEIVDNKSRTQYKDYKYYYTQTYIDGKPTWVQFDTRVQKGTTGKDERHFRLERIYKINEASSNGGTGNIPITHFSNEPTSTTSIAQNSKNVKDDGVRAMKRNTSNTAVDNQGRTLTKQQQEYFKNSKVRDENGNLLVMYHGTEANVGIPETSWFTIFDIDKAGNHGSMLGDGFYFTSNKSHAEQYAHTRGNIYETYLNIENPLELDYFSTGELAYAIRKINPYIEADIYKRDGTIDGYKVRRYLLDNGYDGIHSGNTYVAFNSNQIKNVTNTMPTEKQDIRYMKKSNNVTDNQGRVLSKQQEEYFKNSKVRDKNGNLKTVYHGTPYDFNTFNYNKLGENTSSLGAGFYFTDTKTTAEQYGNLKEVYVNITKPLSYGKTTMSKTEYQNFITEIDNETNGRYLEDYGSLDEALKEYDYGGDDIDLISAVQTASGLTWDKTFEILKETTGFDGIISDEGFLNKGETLYVAFNSNQIKNVTNKTPTPNKDIRFAKKNAKTPKVDGDILEPGQTNAQRASNYIEQEIRKIEETGNWDDTIPVTKMTDIRKTIENYLGIGVQKGHFRQQAYGIYKGNRDVIRTKELKDMDTILHETGHALDIGKRIKIDKESISNELLTAVKKYGGYEAETRQVQLEEGFAEVIREYAIVPEQARIDYPQTVAVLEGIRQTDKDFNNFITTVQQQTYNYIHQNPENRGVSNISVGERTDRPKWSKEYVKQELMRNVWDKDWATKSVVNEIQKIKGKKMSDLKASENAYYLTRLSSGIGDKVVSMLSKGYIDENGNKLMPGLDNIGEILGNNPERFTDFRALITANRDLDYKARLQKTGIRTEDARAIREKFKNDQQLQESAKIFYDTADGVLQYVVNNGLLTQEAADSIRKSNAFYAPMQRVLNGNKNNVGRRGAVKDVIKATTGSELDIKDPLENLIVNSVNMIQQVENNNILKALYKQGEEAGMTGKIYDVIPAPMVKIGTAKLSTWENELKSQGVDITKIDLEKTIDLFAPDTKIDPNNLITSFINDNGNRVYLQFHDEILFNSLMNMDKKFMSAILNFNRKINMPLRYGATMANIGFAIPNMVSDTAQAAIFSEAGFIPVLDNLIGVMDIVSAQNKTAREFFNKVIPGYADRINTMYALYEQTGATSATRMSQYREQTQNLMKNVYGTKNSEVLGIKERFKPLKRFLDIMTYIPEISEQSTRFRVFEKNLEYYRKNGTAETDARIQAALQSRDATQDFGRTGNVTREINQLIPFSAARVGSAYTFAEKVKANPKRVAGRLALLMTLSTFIKAIGYDDDEIEELNQRKKNDNFVLKIGDQIITIKKPQGILRSIINFGEYIQDLFTGNIEEGKEGERLSELIQSAIMDNMPADSVTGLVPNMVAPVVENAINKDLYYNSDIVKSYDLELPDNEQYYDYNSQLAIWLGQIFNYSPAKIDNLISGYFAGLGTSVTNVIDWISGKMGLSPEEANMGAENNAVGKRFFVNVNSNSASVDDVYTLKTELKKKENGDTITADETQQLNALEEATTNMAKLNKQIKEIKKSMTLSADEKAEQIRVLQEQKTDVARKALGKDLLYSTSSEIENMKFYPSRDTISKNKRTLTLTTEMKKEYEQVASEYYEKYEKQGLYNKKKLEQIESKAKDYAKNYMFKKYKDKLQED